MLLLSWNVAGRLKRLPEQAERLLALRPDVICLQEVTHSTLAPWRTLLTQAGYHGLVHGEFPANADRTRRLAVLTCARERLQPVAIARVPWPERVLAVRLTDGTELLNVHSPISPKPDHAKVRTHQAVHRHLIDAAAISPRILCGDLNTPRKEHPDGRVWTFARDRYGRLRPDRGECWDEAELCLIQGLKPHGFRDAFRALHGPARRELSWEWPRWGGGYRLDHLLVSEQIGIADCHYEHGWRTEGLSDHSALVARLRTQLDSSRSIAHPRPCAG